MHGNSEHQQAPPEILRPLFPLQLVYSRQTNTTAAEQVDSILALGAEREKSAQLEVRVATLEQEVQRNAEGGVFLCVEGLGVREPLAK